MSNEEKKQFCPICGVAVTPYPRYPSYLCRDCSRKATDENGRALLFGNESFSGGFVAKYADTGEARDSHICFVDGVRCVANEAHMGGIVIKTAEAQT